MSTKGTSALLSLKAAYDAQRVHVGVIREVIANASTNLQDTLHRVLHTLKMSSPSQPQLEELQAVFDIALDNAKEAKQEADYASYREQRRRALRDEGESNVTFLLPEADFLNYTMDSRSGWQHKDTPACTFLRAEYYRCYTNGVRAKNALESASVEDPFDRANVDVYEKFFTPIAIHVPSKQTLLGTKSAYNSTTTALLVWLVAFDRKNLPLNSIAVRIMSKFECYGRGYQDHKLPHDVAALLKAWMIHASKVHTGGFAHPISLLADPTATVHQVEVNCTKGPGMEELRAVILAFQNCIMRVIDQSSSDASTIPLNNFWDRLMEVDELAIKFKALHYRESVMPSDLSTGGTPFNYPELLLGRLTDAQGNKEVEGFISRLKLKRSLISGSVAAATAAASPAASPQVRGPVSNSASPATQTKLLVCNYCLVKTNDHKGQTCPWKGIKPRHELKKMSEADRKKGPS